MSYQEYISKIKSIQDALLSYIDEENQDDELYHRLIELKIHEDNDNFKAFLYLISKISNTHYRSHEFYNKIDKLLHNFKNEILKNYSNPAIFDIFSSNKRIILFLIQSNIINIDEYILSQLQIKNYLPYFSPEIKKLGKTAEKEDETNESFEDFENKRLTGENDSYLCKLIREDSLEEFVKFINKTNLSLKGQIQPSIFETNTILNEKSPTLIEYAAFFGSIQIFIYLMNKVDLEISLCPYAIHGRNAEIINFFEENTIDTENEYIKCFEEAIRCHHKEIADYFENKLTDFPENDKNRLGLIYYNYDYIDKLDILDSYLCDNVVIFEKIVKTENTDLNKLMIHKKIKHLIKLFIYAFQWSFLHFQFYDDIYNLYI